MKEPDKEKVVNWDNLSENLDDLNIDGVLNGEDSNQHIVATEEEFQELLKGLFE
ncbi:hypothetical protein [Globicatella sanguinis]|uniref:hypothetical protein n=1 Tax=Globicatella sanguinis TaxID=13076 RepID=UPI0012EE1BB3|nr:hypothetical protein [Globicatella sanguinis]MDK7630171.1 hypothetical protein [Globicatella sanguinis]WIK65980.1 hypothetical protein CYJ72_008620 [Globicatella sanguinis]WKT55385.1 hypothetical protein Q3C38_08620 [Globicatella sanguinis]